ncbi:Sterile alpha motif domain [Sesbania bispinosa]|nr:Sterile alpha motif domain [Sesbania bispinosa]
MAEIQPAEGQMNGGGTLILNPNEPIGTKRQRRPSVRLGDIGGDQPYDSHGRRNSSKGWKLSFDHHRKDNKDSNASSGKPSKTRPLTNLSETLEGDEREGGNIDSVAIGSWKFREPKKRGSVATKRVRTNWVPRIDEGGGGGGAGGEGEEKYSGGEDVDDGYREFDVENSEQSPIHSMEDLGVDGHNRRSFKGREHHDGIELSGPSDNDARDWKCGGTSGDRNENGGRVRSGEDGVRIWLNGLGLGRYAPVFEVHEVDDEVLPMLTLEDLKDMGINAVGSRRKMYCAIQKLGKGFS